MNQLNWILRGWANYFNYGTRLVRFRAVDQYVLRSVRDFLRRRHKVRKQRGIKQFRVEWIYEELGVHQIGGLRLRATA